MSNLSGASPENGATGPFARGETVPSDILSGVPARPMAGSSLEALVRRQAPVAGPAQRLGFVPAQVR